MNNFETTVIDHLLEIKKSQGRLEAQLDLLPCKDHGVMIDRLKSKIPALKIWILSLIISGLGTAIVLLISKHYT